MNCVVLFNDFLNVLQWPFYISQASLFLELFQFRRVEKNISPFLNKNLSALFPTFLTTNPFQFSACTFPPNPLQNPTDQQSTKARWSINSISIFSGPSLLRPPHIPNFDVFLELIFFFVHLAKTLLWNCVAKSWPIRYNSIISRSELFVKNSSFS